MKQRILLFFLCVFCIPAFGQLTIDEDSTQNSTFGTSVELSEVIVKSRKKNMQSKGLGNIRINPEQLAISPLFLGERDIVKTLQFLPGVSAGMEASSQINIRGGTNDQTLYLLDDVPVYNQNHTFGFFSIFNSDVIKNAEIYKGGIPTQYGDKLSGVVSVSLKEGDYKKHHTSFSMGLLALTFASDGYIVKDKLSYNIAARRSFLDLLYNGFMSLIKAEEESMGLISFYDINSKISWKINPKNNLSWQVYNGYDDLYGMNSSKDDYTEEDYYEKSGYGWKTFMTSLRHSSQLNSNIFSSSSIYYTTLDNFNSFKGDYKAPGIKEEYETGTSSLLTEIGGKTLLEHHLTEKHKLFYGLEGAYQEYNPEYVYKKQNGKKITYRTDQLNLFKLSGYVNSDFHYDRLFLNLGIRASLYDNMKKARFAIEPRVKLNYYADDKNKFMLAYDYMSQPVNTINEKNYNVQTDFWLPYQEDKLPKSFQVSLGWKNYTTPDLNFSVEAYYKKMSNLLLIKEIEHYIDFHTNYEEGTGTSMGIELMAEYTKGRYTFWSSYTLSKSRRTFGNETYPFKYDAPHNLHLFGNYRIGKSERKESSVSVNIQYQTGYPYYVPNITYPGSGLPTQSDGFYEINDIFNVDHISNIPNTRLKNYFRIDLNYTSERKLKHGSLVWQFSLLNATNRNNPYAVYKKEDRYKAFVLVPIMPSISFKRKF